MAVITTPMPSASCKDRRRAKKLRSLDQLAERHARTSVVISVTPRAKASIRFHFRGAIRWEEAGYEWRTAAKQDGDRGEA
jgi:hypothetical protein